MLSNGSLFMSESFLTRLLSLEKDEGLEALTFVLLHEIGHIVLSHPDEVPDYICEYETERWTINYLRKCNIHKDYKSDYDEYIIGAKGYVKEHIEKYVKWHTKRELPCRIKKRIGKWASYQNI